MSAPQDLDDESLRRLARSFYVVKMARYAGLLVSALAIAALATSQDAPVWVPVGLVVVAVVFGGALVLSRLRYRRGQRPPSSSPSPRG